MKEYLASITIAATPEAVWAILIDAPHYRDWNPEIVAIDGTIAAGARITAHVRLGSGAVRAVPQRITALDSPRRMEWTGGLPLGLFVGRRTFSVRPTNGGAEFRLHLCMSGPLSTLILNSVGNRQPEIDAFSTALKHRAEQATTFA